MSQPYQDVALPLTVGWGDPADAVLPLSVGWGDPADAVLPLSVGWGAPVAPPPYSFGSASQLAYVNLSAGGLFYGTFTVPVLAVSAGLQALGSVVFSGSESGTVVTAGLSAAGSAFAASNLFGGDSALSFTFPFTFGGTPVTVVLSASGAITAGAPFTVTVVPSAAGLFGLTSGGALTVTTGLPVVYSYGFTGGPSGAVSAGLSAAGSVTTGVVGNTSASFTAGLSASGVLDVAGARPVIIANPQVGPQALRKLFQRKPQGQAQITGFVGGDSSPLPFSFPLTFSGTGVAVGLSAGGHL